jgi:hypothetical protein
MRNSVVEGQLKGRQMKKLLQRVAEHKAASQAMYK